MHDKNIPENGKNAVGRPSFKPTDEQREKVSVLRAGGMGVEDIARAIGITHPTLRKHFNEELTVGCAMKRAEVIQAMHKAAIGGNVAAQGKFMALVKAAEAPPPLPKSPILGKKEAADVEAQTAHEDTSWGELVH